MEGYPTLGYRMEIAASARDMECFVVLNKTSKQF